jgi:hypothetical protein
MPQYIYQNPNSEEYKLVFQGINDVHEYIDDSGLKWNRVFTTPQVSTVGAIDPFSQNDFVNKTSQKKGSYGDLVDQSKELSAKRAEQLGYDPVQNKYFDDYSKSRRGIKHPKDTRGNDSKDYSVDF